MCGRRKCNFHRNNYRMELGRKHYTEYQEKLLKSELFWFVFNGEVADAPFLGHLKRTILLQARR